MNTIQDIIEDVGNALDLGNGCELSKKDERKIVKGIKRILDRFSIDARKLPTVCQIEHTIQIPDNRLSVGRGKRFDVWGKPVAIHYAAWGHKRGTCQEYTTCAGTTISGGGLCEQPMRVSLDDGLFHKYSTCRELECSRPTDMYYQRGEIVFNSKPYVGDTLILRAVMPFDDQLLLCCDEKDCDKPDYEFSICPDHMLDMQTREKVLCLAQNDFNGDPCWEGHYCIHPCDDVCIPAIDVAVKPVKKNDFCPHKFKLGAMELPEGYYDAIYRTLVYDMALSEKIPRDAFMRADRDDATKLLNRANDRVKPHEKDLTTYWSRRRGYDCTDVETLTPRGICH